MPLNPNADVKFFPFYMTWESANREGILVAGWHPYFGGMMAPQSLFLDKNSIINLATSVPKVMIWQEQVLI